jgi:hypothetical protein
MADSVAHSQNSHPTHNTHTTHTHTVKSGHSKSLTTLKSSKSEKTIPDFNQIHTNYSKALVRGRHPNSFPKQSELWYHFRASSDRVKKVAFGYDLWEVIEEHEAGYRSADKKVQIKENADELKAEVNTMSTQAHPNAIQMRTINGVQIDMKGQVPMHYGMVFIMMNMMEEVLCVNKWDEVKCKPIQNIDPTDRICFKVLQLLDPTNPGVLKYGSPMWLQLMDSSLSDGEAAWQNSHVLAAKPYAPPEMGSMDLDRVWGQTGSLRDKDKEKPGSADVSTPMFPKISASSKYPTTPTALQSNKNAAMSSVKPSSTKQESSSAKSSGKEDDPGETKEGEGAEDTTVMSPAADQPFVAERNSSIDNEQLAAIIGDLQPARIVDIKRDSDAVMAGPRNHTKTAQYMGQWVGRLATRSKLKTDVIHTQSPIYLEQDLYCLATSHGTGFKPWPKSSSEIEYREANFPKLIHMNGDTARPSTFENMNRMMGLVKTATKQDRLIGGSPGMGLSNLSSASSVSNSAVPHSGVSTASSHHARSTSSSSANESAHKPAHRDIGEYGCVRKVSIRGPPYKSLVDRRCVWKFCQVDTQGDMQSLSVKDQITQRLMNRARVELRKSEQNRKGICIHKGYEYRGQPLTRGEGFTRTLRAIILQNTHNREVTDMQERRGREKHLQKYFANMVFGEENSDGDYEYYDEYDEEDEEDQNHRDGDADDYSARDDHTIMSQLSDDHFSPYKESASGTETWDEPIIKNIIFGARGENIGNGKAGGDAKPGEASHLMKSKGSKGDNAAKAKAAKKRRKSRSPKRAGTLSRLSEGTETSEGEDNTINTSAAHELIEHAFHVEKFLPQYLPKKPLAYTAPVYDQEGVHYASSKDAPGHKPHSASHHHHEHKRNEGVIGAMIAEDVDTSRIDFAATLSQELDDISHHKPLKPMSSHVNGDSNRAGLNHLAVHIPAHPLGHHGHHPAALSTRGHPPSHGTVHLSHHVGHSGGAHRSMNADHHSDNSPKETRYSRDGTRVLALDNHIDLFQSDGERVVGIHDMMDYITSKTAVEAKTEDSADSASTSSLGGTVSAAGGSLNGQKNSSTRLATRLTSRFTNIGILAATSNIQNGNPLENVAAVEAAINQQNASIAAKIAKLKSQDTSLTQVLQHRDSMEQYRKLTQLFQDINSTDRM